MIKDSVELSTQEITPEGYLRAKASVTCVGIQDYYGEELIDLVPDLMRDQIYKVFRPPHVVFAPETVKSLSMKPITDDHPNITVDSENYRNNTVGWVGEKIEKINDSQLGASLLISDKESVQRVKDGLRQVSLGYDVNLKKESGSYNGEKYDLMFDGAMIVNHLALVPEGRCGEGARILDRKKNEVKMIKDIDMDSLIGSLAEKVMPKIEALIDSDEFKDRLADVVGHIVTKSMDSPEDEQMEKKEIVAEDQPVGEPELAQSEESDIDAEMEDKDELKKEDREMCDQDEVKKEEENMKKDSKIVQDELDKRLKIILMAKELSSNEIDYKNKSSKAILKDSLSNFYKSKDLENKSVDYMLGLSESLLKSRQDASQYIQKINDKSGNDSIETPRIKNALHLRSYIKACEGGK